MGFMDNLRRGLERSRETLSEIFYMGGEVTEDFWDDLEDTLVMGDMGAEVAMRVTDDLRERAARENLMIAGRAHANGVKTLIGGADTFRAAAIEQLQVWGERSGIEVVTRERGADPASVCFEVVETAEKQGTELVLIDTAGRLHTSSDLMRELAKVVSVTRKRAGDIPVSVVLVIDATTGQNGLNQAKEFNDALSLDGLIVTKLDGTAKGGIALAISNQLNLPIYRIGVGESIDDLQTFDARSQPAR